MISKYRQNICPHGIYSLVGMADFLINKFKIAIVLGTQHYECKDIWPTSLFGEVIQGLSEMECETQVGNN